MMTEFDLNFFTWLEEPEFRYVTVPSAICWQTLSSRAIDPGRRSPDLSEPFLLYIKI